MVSFVTFYSNISLIILYAIAVLGASTLDRYSDRISSTFDGYSNTLFGLEPASFQGIGMGVWQIISCFLRTGEFSPEFQVNSFVFLSLLIIQLICFNEDKSTISEKQSNPDNQKKDKNLCACTRLFTYTMILVFVSQIFEGSSDIYGSKLKYSDEFSSNGKTIFSIAGGISKIFAPFLVYFIKYISKKIGPNYWIYFVSFIYVITQYIRNTTVENIMFNYEVSSILIWISALGEPLGSAMLNDILISSLKKSFNHNHYRWLEQSSGAGKYFGLLIPNILPLSANIRSFCTIFSPIILIILGKKRDRETEKK